MSDLENDPNQGSARDGDEPESSASGTVSYLVKVFRSTN